MGGVVERQEISAARLVRARCRDHLFDFVFGQNLEAFAGVYCMSVFKKKKGR
jgi:hypothetical protein